MGARQVRAAAARHLPLDQLSPTAVRGWHASLLGAGAPTPPRQAYALLRAILNTAVADELLTRNPCLVRGAGVGRSVERSVATLAPVQALAEAVPARYRMLILLAAWSGARWGELVALSRDKIDLERGTMRIDRQYVKLDNSLVLDSPKSAAGVRTVHIPPHLLPEPGRTSRSTPAVSYLHDRQGRPAQQGRLPLDVGQGAGAGGAADFRFHDLRHTGNTLAASTGASTKELIARMGHASMRAALIYQHTPPLTGTPPSPRRCPGYRDISLQNVLLKVFDGGAVLVKLSDFGLVKDQASEYTRTHTELRGTIRDPLLENFKEYSVTNEIYAIGSVLSFIFTGRESLRAGADDVGRIIRKCVDHDADQRYASAREIIADVEALVAMPTDAPACCEEGSAALVSTRCRR